MSQSRVHVTQDQKSTLVDIVKNDNKLLSGKFSTSFTAKDAQRRWEKVASLLNSIPGATKDWKQWRKLTHSPLGLNLDQTPAFDSKTVQITEPLDTADSFLRVATSSPSQWCWQDFKSATKTKKANIIRHQEKTGGGDPPVELLSPTEEAVLEVINPIALKGLDIRESKILSDKIPEAALNNRTCTTSIESMFENDFQSNSIIHNFKNPVIIKENKDFGHGSSHVLTQGNMNSRESVNNKFEKIKQNNTSTDKRPSNLSPKSSGKKQIVEEYSVNLAKEMRRQNDIKEEYYKKKLIIMERQAEALQNIATTLSSLTPTWNL